MVDGSSRSPRLPRFGCGAEQRADRGVQLGLGHRQLPWLARRVEHGRTGTLRCGDEHLRGGVRVGGHWVPAWNGHPARGPRAPPLMTPQMHSFHATVSLTIFPNSVSGSVTGATFVFAAVDG